MNYCQSEIYITYLCLPLFLGLSARKNKFEDILKTKPSEIQKHLPRSRIYKHAINGKESILQMAVRFRQIT